MTREELVFFLLFLSFFFSFSSRGNEGTQVSEMCSSFSELVSLGRRVPFWETEFEDLDIEAKFWNSYGCYRWHVCV